MRFFDNLFAWFVLPFVLCVVMPVSKAMEPAFGYDPARAQPDAQVTLLDFTVDDQQRDRMIPLRVYMPLSVSAPVSRSEPTDAGRHPVVLFSHGLGGDREGNAYLGKHWASRGYVVVFLQHAGSDRAVWEGKNRLQAWHDLQKAVSAENLLARVQDVPVVLDRLAEWNMQDDHQLFGQMNLALIGMSGHSFGAITTQWVAGQRTPQGAASLVDERIDAAVIMSPSSPPRGTPAQAFGQVALPWLLMTGTDDIAAVGQADMESRLSVYPALPVGDKFELVLDGGTHAAFSDHQPPGHRIERNPNHHPVIVALSTAFWDTYLLGDPEARAWLTGQGPTALLQAGDRWQIK
jgi:predicted dienelactone hydrolase